MTGITFHGGVKEIGGNKFLVEDKGTKIFMDFGAAGEIFLPFRGCKLVFSSIDRTPLKPPLIDRVAVV